MDLYIQVGVILLLLTALSLFIFIYTSPAADLNNKSVEANETLGARLDSIDNLDIKKYEYPNVLSGDDVRELIKGSDAGKLAVFVHTVGQDGLVVNYGYQLRDFDDFNYNQKAFGVSGYTISEFERSYVTTIKQLFTNTGVIGKNQAGVTAYIAHDPYVTSKSAGYHLQEKIEQKPAKLTAAMKGGEGYEVKGPLLLVQDPIEVREKLGTNEIAESTMGVFYTEQVLSASIAVNTNSAHYGNVNSRYYINPESKFKTSIIKTSVDEVVGVFIEETGIPHSNALLAPIAR